MICQTRRPYSSLLFADDSTLSTSFAEENALEFTLTLNHELVAHAIGITVHLDGG